MIIAVASDGLDVSSHFGRCSNYNCYTIKNGSVAGFQNMPSLSRPCSQMISVLMEMDVDVLITGSIGLSAKTAFGRAGIAVVTGASGNAREAVELYLDGDLDSTEETCANEPC